MKSVLRRHFLAALLASLPLCLLSAQRSIAQDPLDILFFGNSFTNATCCGSSVSVPSAIRAIAVRAGHPAPNVRNASFNGQSLQWHIDNNTAVINTGISAAADWDFVVLQDHSTMPTRLGNVAQHLSSSLELYQLVAARSANVVPVMYETWARGPGFSYYTGGNPVFPGGPAEMQAEVREGSMMATANINNTVGMDVARYAPVGDTWEAAGFPLDFYAGDIYHANNRGTMLNALILYGTIYGDNTTSDINISQLLPGLGLTAADATRLTALADAALVPEPTGLVLLLLPTIGCLIRPVQREDRGANEVF